MLSPIYEKYVSTGKVELIYLDFPLNMHPHAFKAAEAAACAGDQNMFWEMHHLLFANQKALSPDRLPGYAKELELDVAAFEKCLSSGRHGKGIREDIRVVRGLGITGTPAYLLGRRIPGGDKIEVLEIIKGSKQSGGIEEKINALLVSK